MPRHPKSSYAVETPAIDGERLYVLFGDVGLYCYDLAGKQLWSHPIDPKKTLSNYGAAASPVVHDGQVLLLYDNQEQSYLVSLDAKTGKQRWRTERDESTHMGDAVRLDDRQSHRDRYLREEAESVLRPEG